MFSWCAVARDMRSSLLSVYSCIWPLQPEKSRSLRWQHIIKAKLSPNAFDFQDLSGVLVCIIGFSELSRTGMFK
jgi:hypothetical protein